MKNLPVEVNGLAAGVHQEESGCTSFTVPVADGTEIRLFEVEYNMR